MFCLIIEQCGNTGTMVRVVIAIVAITRNRIFFHSTLERSLRVFPDSVAQRQSVGVGAERSRVRNLLRPTGFPLGKKTNRHC